MHHTDLKTYMEGLRAQMANIERILTNPSTLSIATKPLNEAMMGAFSNQLLESVGAGLTEPQQEWLTVHLLGLPMFLRTSEGQRHMAEVIAAYRRHMGA